MGIVALARIQHAGDAADVAEVEVEDVYWTVVETITPIHACGVLGIMPVFVLLGLVGLRRLTVRACRDPAIGNPPSAALFNRRS